MTAASSNRVDFDVVVVGDGTAGLAAAIAVRKQRPFRVAIVGRSLAAPVQAPELLPANEMQVFQRLGIWRRFLAEHHAQIIDRFGTGPGQTYIYVPDQTGWTINRPWFDDMLISEAKLRGVAFRPDAAPDRRNDDRRSRAHPPPPRPAHRRHQLQVRDRRERCSGRLRPTSRRSPSHHRPSRRRHGSLQHNATIRRDPRGAVVGRLVVLGPTAGRPAVGHLHDGSQRGFMLGSRGARRLVGSPRPNAHHPCSRSRRVGRVDARGALGEQSPPRTHDRPELASRRRGSLRFPPLGGARYPARGQAWGTRRQCRRRSLGGPPSPRALRASRCERI